MALSTPLLDGGIDDEASKKAKWTKLVFMITFINYAMAHFSRKCYTNVKTDMVAAGIDKVILSQMDTAFMLTYAFGSFISGRLGDMFPQNVIIGVGLLGSTFCLGMIQYLEQIDLVHTSYSLAFFLFISAQFIHGLFQSTGGPVNTAVTGNWFGAKNKGLIYGLWTCHQYVGDIVAAVATALIIRAGLPWQAALLLPGVLNGVWGLLNFVILPNHPSELGIGEKGGKKVKSDEAAIGFLELMKLPNLISFALAFGFFKFVNYCMFFWLPFFLSQHFSSEAANLISTLYSVGMMPGGVIIGYASDLFGGRRASVIAVFMLILAPLLWVFAVFSSTMNPILLLLLLALMGILVGGPNNIITSAVVKDLSEHPSIQGGRSIGTLTGFINGAGSVTAALGLMLIGPLQSVGGWPAVWYFLIACVLSGTALMGPKILKELDIGQTEAAN